MTSQSIFGQGRRMQMRPHRCAAPLSVVVARCGVAGGARARAALRTHCFVVVLRIGRFEQQGRSWFGPRRRMRPSRCAALLSAVGARSDAASWRPRLRRRALPRVRDVRIRRLAHYFSLFAPSLVRPALRACVAALLARCECAAARSAVPLALAAASAMMPS